MKRILIIEDDETIAAIERDYLVLNEFEVDIVGTGSEGIARGRCGNYDLILLAFLLLGEPVSIPQIFGVLGIGIGTLLMISKKEDSQEKSQGKSWLVYAFLSAVFASLTSIFGKIGVENVESNLGTAIRTVVVLVMAWGMVFVTGEQKDLRKIDRKSAVFLFLSGITTGLSWLCYYRALQDGPASVVVPIDKLSILVTIVFSGLVLKEKLSPKAGVGLALILAGTGAMLF